MGGIEGLGLKCGLEIHQQLGRRGDTKLFSRTYADLQEGEPDVVVTRQLRASAGEMGTVDVAAAAEQAKAKTHVYHGFHGTASLVETDEEPPAPVNDEAVRTVVMVANACKSTVLPRVQFMRKTIVDGSAVSGFQRTGLMALGGVVPDIEPTVRIQSICLEEDSAKIVEKTPERDVYNLSRLGIPLIELATAPDITTPEQAKDVAQQIGMVLRSTGRVKRGLGTIRQDLNVSIKGGARCEIKGAQDLKMVPTTIMNEALRQAALLAIKKELKKLTISEVTDVTDAFASSSVKFVSAALQKGNRVLGVSVKGFKGYFGRELYPNFRLGTEFAGIAKTWGFGGVIHSDEDLKKYDAKHEEVQKLLGCNEKDGYLLLVGPEEKLHALFALQLVPRIHGLLEGIPQEVRKANADGSSTYLRPVPGAARMYPETDIPIVDIDTTIPPPKLLTEQIAELVETTGLSQDLATQLIQEGIPILEFKETYPDLSFAFLSNALLEWPRDVTTRLNTDLGDPIAYVSPLLPLAQAGTIAESSVKAILQEIGEHNKKQPVTPSDVERIAKKYKQLPEKELYEIIDAIIAKQPDAKPNQLMGVVMAKVQGRAEGSKIMQYLKERLA